MAYNKNNPLHELVSGDIYWDESPNTPNQLTLIKSSFVLGKNWLNDKTTFRQYGWIEQIKTGEQKGKFEASIPFLSELDESHEDYKEVESLGVFADINEAKKAILQANHPSYSLVWL